MPSPMLPRVTSFILCDSITRDYPTNKLSLLGVFDVLRARAFPAEFPNTWLYCALTECRGEVLLTFRLTDASDLHAPAVLTVEELPVRFRGPLDVAEVVLSLAELRFPAPGVYVWQAECAGEVFHERRLLVQNLSG